MERVTRFHASEVQPDQLNAIIADHVALEEIRIFRRLLVRRFGLLALAAAAAGTLHWLSAWASSISVGIFLVPPVWVCVLEWRRGRRLAGRLDDVPGAITHEAALARLVRKS